jgi:hypothetical protein
MNPNYTSNNRLTPVTSVESPHYKYATVRSEVLNSQRNQQTSPTRNSRELHLSSSMRPKKEIAYYQDGRPIFKTSFKTRDNYTIKLEAAKMETGHTEMYSPPQIHNFREDNPPSNKPFFVVLRFEVIFNVNRKAGKMRLQNLEKVQLIDLMIHLKGALKHLFLRLHQ